MWIIELQRDQLNIGARVLAESFQNDPFYIYVLPDAKKREKGLLWLMKKVIVYTMLYGETYATPGIEGVASWLPPGETDVTMYRIIKAGMGMLIFRFGLASYRLFVDNISYAGDMHDHIMKEPHWYLWAIGVMPEHWGKGIGSQLLEPILASADSSSVPCYLETHNERNIRFYEKHGFSVVREGMAPGHNLRVWAMVHGK